MSSHTRGPRKRARKPRPTIPAARPSALPVSRTHGERPPAPWHPLPLSEILILAGAVGAAIGYGRSSSGVPPLLLAGIAAVALGAIEVAWREHRSGYRSHTLLLSFLPVVVLHSATVLLVNALTKFPAVLNIPLLAVDVAVFFVLFRLWRARFLNARARAVARR